MSNSPAQGRSKEALQTIQGRNAMRRLVLAVAVTTASLPLSAVAAEDDLAGTYKLVVEQRTIVDTGEIVPVKNPQGFISYSKDGRMLVLIVRSPRPRPESIEKTTDPQRADLFRTMTAYAGTYEFDGSSIKHHIDLSWNEVWTGTTQVRSVRRDGERLIYTTPPFHFHTDGKKSVNTLVWEKVK